MPLEGTFHMCPRASFFLWGPDSSTMMGLSGIRPGSDRIIPHHRGWLGGPLHRVPWLLRCVRHDRTCFWDVSHTQSKGNHKQIITHNHSLYKQKGGKLLSTLPIYLESSTSLSTIPLPRKQHNRWQTMIGCLGPWALLLQGMNALPSSASLDLQTKTCMVCGLSYFYCLE